MKNKLTLYSLCLVIILASVKAFAQEPPANPAAAIEKALQEENYAQADSLLQVRLTHFFSKQAYDSLEYYVVFEGKLALARKGPDAAIQQMEIFLDNVKKTTAGPGVIRQLYVETADFFSTFGRNSQAYDYCRIALEYTQKMQQPSIDHFALIQNNLGVYAQRMGLLSVSQQHHRAAIKLYESEPKLNYNRLFMSYNAMGGIMYYSSKMDSAQYFFEKAIEALTLQDESPYNKLYRRAIVQNNLAGIYSSQAQTTKAIKAMRGTISDLEQFLALPESAPKKVATQEFLFQAVDNLGAIYKDLGQYSRAKELLVYAYRQKLQHFDADNPELAKSRLFLGQLYRLMRNNEEAVQYLTASLKGFRKQPTSYLFWEADACYSLALVYEELKDISKASAYYKEGDKLYEASLQGDYDQIYLEFLQNSALFYAENDQFPKALENANKGYRYMLRTQPGNSLMNFFQLLNLAEVHFQGNKYKEALKYSAQALTMVNALISNSTTRLDSIKTELKKPRAILAKSKASYLLLTEKNEQALKRIVKDLEEGLAILERRKTILTDEKDINLLMADHSELIQLIKEISYDLYSITQSPVYFDELISLHESGIYTRIRSRLDKSSTVAFANVPPEIREKEKQLKTALSTALMSNKDQQKGLDQYLLAINEWNDFLDNIRSNYPRYYKMRYGSIFKPLGEVQENIPAGTTVIRYLFSGEKLLALVADKNNRYIYSLSADSLEDRIQQLNQDWINAPKTGTLLANLYNQLWAPLKNSLHTQKLIIIPDGILFQLSFETLIPEKVKSFDALAATCLLNQFSFSYRYSLFLLNDLDQKKEFSENLIAFSPGFSDQLKNNYRQGVSDSIELDQTYLSLLPLPFTFDLTKKLQQKFGGKAYTNELSTGSRFKQLAGNHKIIHIGTHAESNNLFPEYSRLIFAKDNSDSLDDNSLYLNELYNCNLSANLAVLTACESGKPGYLDGEGMISLAHAFNYAGSESILTSLWKIDEQSSALIMEFFYEKLGEGLSKDEALRQAKLSYLKEAHGRTLAPRYWAGLVLMGDEAPVELSVSYTTPLLIAGIIIVAIVLFIFLYKRGFPFLRVK